MVTTAERRKAAAANRKARDERAAEDAARILRHCSRTPAEIAHIWSRFDDGPLRDACENILLHDEVAVLWVNLVDTRGNTQKAEQFFRATAAAIRQCPSMDAVGDKTALADHENAQKRERFLLAGGREREASKKIRQAINALEVADSEIPYALLQKGLDLSQRVTAFALELEATAKQLDDIAESRSLPEYPRPKMKTAAKAGTTGKAAGTTRENIRRSFIAKQLTEDCIRLFDGPRTAQVQFILSAIGLPITERVLKRLVKKQGGG